jgi:hypothetical protein
MGPSRRVLSSVESSTKVCLLSSAEPESSRWSGTRPRGSSRARRARLRRHRGRVAVGAGTRADSCRTVTLQFSHAPAATILVCGPHRTTRSLPASGAPPNPPNPQPPRPQPRPAMATQHHARASCALARRAQPRRLLQRLSDYSQAAWGDSASAPASEVTNQRPGELASSADAAASLA